jgi:hypothetical protein
MSRQQYEILIAQASSELKSVETDLEEARELALKAGLTCDSDLPKLVRQHKDGVRAAASTGGHSNTNHLVVLTGNYAIDRVAELRRNLLTRSRNQQPESRGEERWDKPKVPGERRRRIIREKDLPQAPSEPPPSGYIVFVGQMTTKIRHDRSNEQHNQTKVVQEISKMWRLALSEQDRKYYNDFSEQARKEYERQHLEFRATGHYTPSEVFEKVDGTGLWLRKKFSEKNALEKEIAGYETVIFPPRPPELDEEYYKRDQESKERRKQRLREQRERQAAKEQSEEGRKRRKRKATDNTAEV